MSMSNLEKHAASLQTRIRMAHCACFVLATCLAIFVDGNGCILGLKAFFSILLTASVYGVACIVAGFLMVKGRGFWRIISLISLIFYGLMLLPLAL